MSKYLCKHFKGAYYKVYDDAVYNATNSSADGRMVLYKKRNESQMYVRTYNEFFEYLPEHNCHRFERVEDGQVPSEEAVS